MGTLKENLARFTPSKRILLEDVTTCEMYFVTYSDKIGSRYFERKYKKFESAVHTALSQFNVTIENDHGLSDKALLIVVDKKLKTKVKNILNKLSNQYKYNSELEIDGTLVKLRK